MLVAVTGGTGFVGSHTAKALLDAGHRVRLLVRSPSKVATSLEPVGVDADQLEVAVADVTDRAAVEAGLDGVDSIVHAASVYSLDPRRATEVSGINDVGIRNVLEAAIAARLDPIVHVSSVVALLRDDKIGDMLTSFSPPGNSPMTYPASKAAQEVYARSLQEDGHPIVITYPGGVWGPNDPYDGESLGLARAMVRGRLTLVPPMTIPIVDVRDVAAVHAAAMQPGKGPRRFMAGGHAVDGPTIVELVTRAFGRPRTAHVIPGFLAAPAGPIGDFFRSRGLDLGIGREAVWVASRLAQVDSGATTGQLGVGFRSVAETVADQVAWMKADDRF